LPARGSFTLRSIGLLITKHFVFAHVQKTGGRFIKEVCNSYLPADWIVAEELLPHHPLRRLPKSATGLPVFGLVRNPWDWYVSWYHFTSQSFDTLTPRERASWAPVFGDNDATFREAVTAACTGVPVDGQEERWLWRLRERSRDLYTAWHRRIFDRAPRECEIVIGRFENLREDFISFLRRFDVPVDDEFIDRVRRAPPGAGSRRDRYSVYYDDELRELVASRNALVDEFGYVFG
jgi:hypothetical protein